MSLEQERDAGPPDRRWRRLVRRAPTGGSAARRWGLRLGIPLGGLVVVLGLVWLTLPDPRVYATAWPERTAYMERWLSGGNAGERGIQYDPVPLSRIPESVRRAVLVSEDAGFYGHHGFDWHEIGAAIREAWGRRELPRGASTISQQLARNLYLSPSRSPIRKLREALITRRLESRLSKNRILELYLNVIEFGRGLYGVEAAARSYFGTSVSAVTRREAAELAATIPSPRGNNPATRTRSFQWRSRLAYARAFGGVEIDTLGPPPDTIEVVPPTLPDSFGRAAGDTAEAEARTADGAGVDTVPFDTSAADTVPSDTSRTGAIRTDTMRTDTTYADTLSRGTPGLDRIGPGRGRSRSRH